MKCDVSSIPVEDGRYDAVLCTQVLEHVPDPLKALKELHRVLVPGGTLWLSTPFYFQEHEQPYDYFRFTQFGLRYLLEQAGFHECRIEWLGGYYGTLSHQLNLARHFLSIKPRDYGGGVLGILSALFTILLKPTFFLLAGIFAFHDSRFNYIGNGHCIDYSVVAKKLCSHSP
jgi:SAM-dependent methyltransferase